MAASVFYVSAQNSHGIDINKRPLREFGEKLKSDIVSKKIDLSGPFLVELRGKLDDKGKLDVKSSSFTRTEGDAALVEMVKNGILAISDAGFFQYLQSLQSKNLELLVEQTTTEFSAKIAVDQPTENSAKTFAVGFSTLLQLTKAQMGGPNATEAQKKDLALLKFITARAQDSSVIFSLIAPSIEIQDLINEELAKQSANGQ